MTASLEDFLAELARGDVAPAEIARLYTARLIESGLEPGEAATQAHARLVRPWGGRGLQSDLQAGVNAAAGTHRERLRPSLETALDIARALKLRGESWRIYMARVGPKNGTQGKRAWRNLTADVAAEFGAVVERPVDPRPRHTRDRLRERDERQGGRS